MKRLLLSIAAASAVTAIVGAQAPMPQNPPAAVTFW
jgi:hypothetical protein